MAVEAASQPRGVGAGVFNVPVSQPLCARSDRPPVAPDELGTPPHQMILEYLPYKAHVVRGLAAMGRVEHLDVAWGNRSGET